MNDHSNRRKLWIVALLLIFVLSLSACKSAGKDESEGAAKPSNGGGPGEAMNLKGDAKAGAEVFQANCTPCHGDQGKGGVENAGSTDGTVPSLNPVDPTLVNADYKTFATNLDLFLEHGSKPEGDSPTKEMPAFGDTKTLTPQQIADVIAYLISLNKK